MKSYGQIIYEAYMREHNLMSEWKDLSGLSKKEWDRVGQDVAAEINGVVERLDDHPGETPWIKTVDRNKGAGE